MYSSMNNVNHYCYTMLPQTHLVMFQSISNGSKGGETSSPLNADLCMGPAASIHRESQSPQLATASTGWTQQFLRINQLSDHKYKRE